MAMEAIRSIGAQPNFTTVSQAPTEQQRVATEAESIAPVAQPEMGGQSDSPAFSSGHPRPQESGTDPVVQELSTAEKIEQDNERIKKTISDLNKKITSDSEAVFGIHDKTNRITIKIVEKNSKKVIKEFPPDKTLDMIAKVWEIAGIMVDEKR